MPSGAGAGGSANSGSIGPGGAGVAGARAAGAAGVMVGAGSGNAAGAGAGTGGAGGSSGGESGEAGTAGNGGVTTDDCSDLSNFPAGRPRGDLYVIGSGFEADEGNVARIVVTEGNPRDAPQFLIRDGAFDVTLPETIGDYTGLGVYIDRIRDAACSPGDEPLWQMTTGPDSDPDHVWQVTPNTVVSPSAPPCNINGIFDLTVPLPCPAQ